MATLKGGKVGSAKALKKSLKSGEGGGYLQRIPKDGTLLVRFLTEPEEWAEYFEHYDETLKYYPCSDNCPGHEPGADRPSKKWLARALDRSENRVVPLVLTRGLVKSIHAMYEKFGTILDRDFELIRTGEGMKDTTYMAVPEAPEKVNLKRYATTEPLDMVSVLQGILDDVTGSDSDDDEDDDDFPEEKAEFSRHRPKKSAKRAREYDDDLDDEDDDDEDDEPAPRKKKPAPSKGKSVAKPGPKKKPLAKKPIKKRR